MLTRRKQEGEAGTEQMLLAPGHQMLELVENQLICFLSPAPPLTSECFQFQNLLGSAACLKMLGVGLPSARIGTTCGSAPSEASFCVVIHVRLLLCYSSQGEADLTDRLCSLAWVGMCVGSTGLFPCLLVPM